MKSSEYFLRGSTGKLWSKGVRAASQVGSWIWQYARVSCAVLVLAAWRLQNWRGCGGLLPWGTRRCHWRRCRLSCSRERPQAGYWRCQDNGVTTEDNGRGGVELVWACETSCESPEMQSWRSELLTSFKAQWVSPRHWTRKCFFLFTVRLWFYFDLIMIVP